MPCSYIFTGSSDCIEKVEKLLQSSGSQLPESNMNQMQADVQNLNITTASNNSALDEGQSEEPNPKRIKCEDYVCVGDCDEIIETIDKKWQKVGRVEQSYCFIRWPKTE